MKKTTVIKDGIEYAYPTVGSYIIYRDGDGIEFKVRVTELDPTNHDISFDHDGSIYSVDVRWEGDSERGWDYIETQHGSSTEPTARQLVAAIKAAPDVDINILLEILTAALSVGETQ
jgi:hypothetical protein